MLTGGKHAQWNFPLMYASRLARSYGARHGEEIAFDEQDSSY